jgi:hypothetical protein
MLARAVRAAGRAGWRPPWRAACTRRPYAVLSPLSLLPADPAAGAIVSARAHGDVFAEAYLEALEAVVGLPGFGGLVVDDAVAAGGGGGAGAPNGQAASTELPLPQPRPLPDDLLLVCLAHGYSSLEGVVTADDARRGSSAGADAAADAYGAAVAARTRAPLIGATVGSYRYGPFRVRPFVSLTAVRLPSGDGSGGGGATRVEPWVATGGALPRLAAYADIVTADASHFLALASPEAGLKERSGLLSRLAHAFPSGRVACGTAMAAPLRSSDGALPALLFCNFAPVGEDTTAVGFALHWRRGHGDAAAQQAFVDRAVAAAYADAEFDGLQGFAANSALERRFFLSRNAAVGATRPMLPAAAPDAAATATVAAAASATAAPAAVSPSAAAATTSAAAAAEASAALPAPRPLLPGSSFINALPAEAPLPALPLFIVDTVVVPGQRVDFRVFEPRYRLMLKRYFEDGAMFAVTLPPARVGDFYELKADAAAAAEEEVAADAASAAVAAGTLPPTPTVLGAPMLPPACADAPAPAPSASATGGGGGDRRTGTVVCVRHVHSIDGASGRLALQLEGVRRVALDRAWVAPGTFGLVHGSGRWVDDADADAAAGNGAPTAAAAADVAARILALLRGDSPAHTRLRRLLASWGASGKQGVVLAPPGGGSTVGGSAIAGAPSSLTNSGGGGGSGAGTGGSGGTSWDPDPLASLARLSPAGLSWWLGEVLPVPQSVRQLYLDAPTTADRLMRQHAFLSSKLADLAVGAPKSAFEPGPAAVAPATAGEAPGGVRDDPSSSSIAAAAASAAKGN